MAETRYYVNIDSATGTSGKSVTFSLCSGYSPVPSNAVLTGVSYKITMSISKKGTIGQWRTASISLGNGSPYISEYRTSSYSSGTALNSSGNTYSSSERYTYGTTLNFSAADVSVFSGSSVSGTVKASCTGSASTLVKIVCIYVTYVVPYLSWGGTLSAYQSNNQVVLNWDATPSYGNGSGSCTFSIHNGTSWIASGLSASTRSYTLTPTSCGGSITYTVAANYSGLSTSKAVAFTANAPSLSWNNAAPTVTENADGTLTISWNTGYGSWGASGMVVHYALFTSSSPAGSGMVIAAYAGVTVTTATIPAPDKDTYYYVMADYGSLTSTSGRTLYSAHRTVKRWNGSAWEECIVYCYQNGTWVECIPYIYNGSGWELLSH